MTALFLVSAAFCLWTFVLFPVILHLRARRRAEPVPAMPDPLPSVSVVIAAHDEERTLPDKLESLDALDYPQALLQVVIVSDGSGDRTLALLREAARTRPGLTVVHYEEPRGKPTALNAGVAAASGEVLVFMDARQRVSSNAVLELVRALGDPRVGAASGELVLAGDSGRDAADVGLYWRYEKWIRANESRLFSTTGATGALYAIRRADYRAHRADVLLDDFDTPVRLLGQGLRTVFVPAARAFDRAEGEANAEFRRKVRTLAGNFQSFSRHPWLFDPRRNPVWWQFLSHKVCRLLVPYALALALVAAWLGDSGFLELMFMAQLCFYAVGIAGFLGVRTRATNFLRVFLQLNAASMIGALRWASGTAGVRWKRGPAGDGGQA